MPMVLFQFVIGHLVRQTVRAKKKYIAAPQGESNQGDRHSIAPAHDLEDDIPVRAMTSRATADGWPFRTVSLDRKRVVP
jgi:hypothetical protein